MHGLSFELANVGVRVQKSLVLYNSGLVDLRLWAQTDLSSFQIKLAQPPRQYRRTSELDSLPRRLGFHHVQKHNIIITIDIAITIAITSGHNRSFVGSRRAIFTGCRIHRGDGATISLCSDSGIFASLR